MSVQNPHFRVKRWSVVGMEGMWAKMFDPPTESPATPDKLAPTNPVPEVMAAAGYQDPPSTPHTVERDLMHGLKIPTWDNTKELMFFLIRDADNPLAVGTFPGPTLRVPRGVVFHAHTKGHGPPPHTIHWHGQEPTPMNDGVGHCSMEIGDYTYQWQPNFIGSYFYHCHRNTVQHFEFGLYGFTVIEPPDAYFATLKNPEIPIGHCRDGKRRTAANTSTFPEFPGFNRNPLTAPDPLGEYPTDPHAMTVTYDVEALWVFDDRDSMWSDLAPSPFATYPKYGNNPGVDDEFHRNPGADGFFAFNDFDPDYFFVTGVPFPAPKGSTGTIPTGVVIPPELNSGVSGTQVSIQAAPGQTILLRCLNGAYACVEITFPVDIVVIAWDGRALGVPPYGQYNHAYKIPANTPFRSSVARRFDALIKVDQELNSFATVKFINTRGEKGGVNTLNFDVLTTGITHPTGPGGTIQPGEEVLMTALIPIDIGEAPRASTFSISGTVKTDAGAPIKEATIDVEPMSLGGTGHKTAVTDAAGNYSVPGLVNSMYEITPSAPGMTFTPPSTRVTINDANVPAQNFTGTVTMGDLTLTADKPSPQPPGMPAGITFTAMMTGAGPYEYEFKLYDGVTWKKVQDYSTSNTWHWNTTTATAGGYLVKVSVRIVGSTVELAEKRLSITFELKSSSSGATYTPNSYTLPECLDSLKMAVGSKTPTAADIGRYDVAPLLNGIAQPDGRIDLQDVIVILRMAVGLPL